MSDRDRPEWQIAFTLAAGYDEQDAIELYEQIEGSPCVSGAALTAADAVQGGEVEDLRIRLRIVQNALDAIQPADDRRMVDLDAVVWDLKTAADDEWHPPFLSGYHYALKRVREFGGSAPSEETHRPKVPEVARKYDGEHGLVVEFEDEKP